MRFWKEKRRNSYNIESDLWICEGVIAKQPAVWLQQPLNNAAAMEHLDHTTKLMDAEAKVKTLS